MKAVAVILGFIVVSAQATTVNDELSKCRQIKQDLPRLVCYDQIGSPAPAAQPVIVTADAVSDTEQLTTVTVAAPQATATAEQKFGIEHRAAPPTDLPEAVSVVLAKVTKAPRGELVFSFDNGQVWRQVNKESFVAKAGETYQLTRGVLNSFFLGQQDSPRKTRVRRDK